MTAASTGAPTAYLALREDARAVLRSWDAPDPQQDALRVELLEHLDAHEDAMWKQGPPAHLTASALVLNPSLDKVLLTLHAKAGLWLQFGGHFEPQDTSVLAAATREAREESGITALELVPALVHVDRHRLIASGFGRCREHLDLRYAGVATDEAGFAVSEESLDVRWWGVDDLPADSGEEILPLARAARRLLG
ncbi:NUDIX hydrolase [Knoellia sp. p5-6-4]|uniref:NUDIX hydrolase n=1 Tax=unclassified Knoellia TaxID=2618719 RepID=UPI0023D99E33|nr:NUDIX domain-containing protein [Knoellia sp. p5-6-4]MDF2144229.1 NUDIX domain-containing protein [Knoellia sp. p5-6-4]